jgi:steroid 5-alpha reductase family enzyme
MRDEGTIKPMTIIVSSAGALITILISIVGWFLIGLAGEVKQMNDRVWALSQSVAVMAATLPKACNQTKEN